VTDVSGSVVPSAAITARASALEVTHVGADPCVCPSVSENARLFGLLNIALADAAIVSWDCKYVYNFWRPITAIQEADTDGNPRRQTSWTALLATPPFPEYTSGHSTFSGAAALI
jgi:hypothetical protein